MLVATTKLTSKSTTIKTLSNYEGKYMNIRKNYGTTSHDMCYAEIRIDNPVLLEIFERYKALGAFEGSYSQTDGQTNKDR